MGISVASLPSCLPSQYVSAVANAGLSNSGCNSAFICSGVRTPAFGSAGNTPGNFMRVVNSFPCTSFIVPRTEL